MAVHSCVISLVNKDISLTVFKVRGTEHAHIMNSYSPSEILDITANTTEKKTLTLLFKMQNLLFCGRGWQTETTPRHRGMSSTSAHWIQFHTGNHMFTPAQRNSEEWATVIIKHKSHSQVRLSNNTLIIILLKGNAAQRICANKSGVSAKNVRAQEQVVEFFLLLSEMRDCFSYPTTTHRSTAHIWLSHTVCRDCQCRTARRTFCPLRVLLNVMDCPWNKIVPVFNLCYGSYQQSFRNQHLVF